MTKILHNTIRDTYELSDVSYYEAQERVIVVIPVKNACIEKRKIYPEHVKNIADLVFNVPFDFCESDHRHFIAFEPVVKKREDLYALNHEGHYIEMTLPQLGVGITICTRNRGAHDLFEEQRKRYLAFVKGVYDFLDTGELLTTPFEHNNT